MILKTKDNGGNMTKKFSSIGLRFCLIATLSLASIGVAVPGEQPQYGGKLTYVDWFSNVDPGNPDIGDGGWYPTQWLGNIQERPLVGDFETYGPRGTGEYPFQLDVYIPEQYLKGNLLESWEITPKKLIWNVRPGIIWQGLNQGRRVMKDRELTAADVVADLLYFKAAPGGKLFSGMAGDIYKTGRYSLVIEFKKGLDIYMMYVVGQEDRSQISPPEIEGSSSWADQVGTGPFMLKEYVVGSHMTYERNPNYWAKTTVDGVEYNLPFLDEVVWPIIPDESTRIAALRSGRIDYYDRMPSSFWGNLDKTAPKLESARSFGSGADVVILRTTTPPFDNLEVRRAMTVATDMKAFADLHHVGSLPKHTYPIHPDNPDVYTPLKELPEKIRILYDYNPEKAKQMLKDAGYPNGFTIQHQTRSIPEWQDRAALLKDMWSKVGVTVEINVVDDTTFYSYDKSWYKKKNLNTRQHGLELADPVSVIRMATGHHFNFPEWSNKSFDKLSKKIVAEIDFSKRNKLVKEASLIMLDETIYIPLAFTPQASFWWPWIKNYYAEINIEDQQLDPVIARVWIDQALKAKMGY